MKQIYRFLFLLSEAMGAFAGSVYALIISFVIQRTITSQFINSLVANLGITISLIVSFLAGSLIDRKSPRKVILLSDTLLLPFLLLLIFIGDITSLQQILFIVVVDIIAVILSELDSIARPRYLKLTFATTDLDKTIQGMNNIQSLFAISGYLIVFLTIAHWQFHQYFIMITLLYSVSAISIYLLPKEKIKETRATNKKSCLRLEWKQIILFITHHKGRRLFHALYILYLLKNQLVMSLLIFRIGQLNPSFNRIPTIGAGIISGISCGIALSYIMRKTPKKRKQLCASLLLLLSALPCFYLGHVLQVTSFYGLGLAIGLIFGLGLPLFNLLSSKRLQIIPHNMLGKNLAILKMTAVLLALMSALPLNFLDNLGLHSAYFDFAALLTIVCSFLFPKLSLVDLSEH